MKRLFGPKKRKIKIGGDEDDDETNIDHYPPPTNHNTLHNPNNYAPPTIGNSSSSAYDFQQVRSNNSNASSFPNVDLDNSSYTTTTPQPLLSPQTTTPPITAPPIDPNDQTPTAGYRYALTAYNDTISPVLSNEDGLGGGGGTLRSRLGRSGGTRHQSLIPVFAPMNSYRGDDVGDGSTPLKNNLASVRGRGGKEWMAIPEEPHSTSSPIQQLNDDENTTTDNHHDKSSQRGVTFEDEHARISEQHLIPPSSTRSTHTSTPSPIPSINNNNPNSTNKYNNNNSNQPTIIHLQPNAIYTETYGDAYISSLPQYLYPSGYQSMRPRSGPWKLSMFIFGLFLWLSVFIVGHCYDRGKMYGMIDDDDDDANNDNNNNQNGGDDDNNNNNNVDDAYLEEVDDDAVLMETRWCGSKLLHFMWMISVTITVLAMSYCSIIGYVKVRDVVVAAGRSQPAGTFDGDDEEGGGGGGGLGWKSDYYSKVDNVKDGTATMTTTTDEEECRSNQLNSNGEYTSYQTGGGDGSSRRYAPSIYQSDGMPQFLGGHIYRPTQAAITMTNRP